MRLPYPADWHWTQIAFVAKSPLIEQRFRPIPQRTLEPISNGDSEAHLGAFDQLARDVLIQHLPQQPFRLTVADFILERHTPREFHHPVVKERDPPFKRNGHRSAIELRQDIVR